MIYFLLSKIKIKQKSKNSSSIDGLTEEITKPIEIDQTPTCRTKGLENCKKSNLIFENFSRI